MRIALGIEYDGTAYNGWQRQKTGLGVQQRLEEALISIADHSRLPALVAQIQAYTPLARLFILIRRACAMIEVGC